MGSRHRSERRVVPGIHPVRELVRSGAEVDEVVLASGSQAASELRGLAEEAGLAVRETTAEEVERVSGGVAHQGAVALAPPYRYATLDEVLEPRDEAALLVALDGVTDPHNLGSIARTAEAAGAAGIVIPGRRAAGVTPAAEKVAAGALAHLPVARVPNLARAVAELGERGVWSLGLDADGEQSVFGCGLLVEPLVLVVGAEGRGISRLVAERCDLLVALPMRGRVASLNAAVAAAIALYETRRMRET